MNIDNKINKRIEMKRTVFVRKLVKKHPSLIHLEYNSAHLAFVKILTNVIRKRAKKKEYLIR